MFLDDSFDDFVRNHDLASTTTLRGWSRRLDTLRTYYPDGFDSPPALRRWEYQATCERSLAESLNLHGLPNRANVVFARHDVLCRAHDDSNRLSDALALHGKSRRQCGEFRLAESLTCEAISLLRAESASSVRIGAALAWLGMSQAHRGASLDSATSFDEAIEAFGSESAADAQGVIAAFRAQRALWLGDADSALHNANAAWAFAETRDSAGSPDRFRARKVTASAARMRGEAYGLQGRKRASLDSLFRAYGLARPVSFVEEMIPALKAMAEVTSGPVRTSVLAEAAKLAELGGYRPFMAEILLTEGHVLEARTAAQCDGHPYAYQRVLDLTGRSTKAT